MTQKMLSGQRGLNVRQKLKHGIGRGGKKNIKSYEGENKSDPGKHFALPAAGREREGNNNPREDILLIGQQGNRHQESVR